MLGTVMKNSKKPNLMLPGFYLPRRGRRPHSKQKIFESKIVSLRKMSFQQIGQIFGKFVPCNQLKPESSGNMSRRTIFSKENTFWSFFGQIVDADRGCKEVVRKLQSYASFKGIRVPSSSTASYCAARKKLDESTLANIFKHTATKGDQPNRSGLLNQRRIIVVDGTGLSMPDTLANQALWPQTAMQKPGCGFPNARILGFFSLESGSLLSYAIGNKKKQELPLLREQWQTFKEGDIFLGDKGFCSYFDQVKLKEKNVDSIITVARRKPVSKKDSIKPYSSDDLLIKWNRPVYNKALSYTKETWKELPSELLLRQIRVVVNRPGFRPKIFYIVTTLLDPEEYSSKEIALVYLKRWEVELFFRDIKTTMGMDILRCQSPNMIHKEILMNFIAYNCIRRLMYEAAIKACIPVRLVSFKGSLQAVRNWEPYLNGEDLSNREKQKILDDLYAAVTGLPLRQRPGRREPRCLKRRPKNYQLLTKPRHKMVEMEHRSKYKKLA